MVRDLASGEADALPRRPVDAAAYERRSREGPASSARPSPATPTTQAMSSGPMTTRLPSSPGSTRWLVTLWSLPEPTASRVTGRAAIRHEPGQSAGKPACPLARRAPASWSPLRVPAVGRLLLGPRRPGPARARARRPGPAHRQADRAHAAERGTCPDVPRRAPTCPNHRSAASSTVNNGLWLSRPTCSNSPSEAAEGASQACGRWRSYVPSYGQRPRACRLGTGATTPATASIGGLAQGEAPSQDGGEANEATNRGRRLCCCVRHCRSNRCSCR